MCVPTSHWQIILTLAIIAWVALSAVVALLVGPILKARSWAVPERDFQLLTDLSQKLLFPRSSEGPSPWPYTPPDNKSGRRLARR